MYTKKPASRTRRAARRLTEPSTYAGLSVLAALFGMPPGLVETSVQAIAGIGALAAIVLPEKKNPTFFD